jgi:hypothetical protein
MKVDKKVKSGANELFGRIRLRLHLGQRALLAEYIKAPEVTRRRIYIETLQDVMPGLRSKIIVDEQTRGILPLLNLDSQKGDRP